MCGTIDPSGTLASLGVSTTSALGAVSISLIGLANIAGTLLAGWLGKRLRRNTCWPAIYTARTLIAAAFILFPITPTTVRSVLDRAWGALWLATVPLTSGLVAHIYGLRYMGTLYGIVFFSHQLGSFLGVWLGGRMYDLTGDYTFVWWIGVGVGAFSAHRAPADPGAAAGGRGVTDNGPVARAGLHARGRASGAAPRSRKATGVAG